MNKITKYLKTVIASFLILTCVSTFASLPTPFPGTRHIYHVSISAWPISGFYPTDIQIFQLTGDVLEKTIVAPELMGWTDVSEFVTFQTPSSSTVYYFTITYPYSVCSMPLPWDANPYIIINCTHEFQAMPNGAWVNVPVTVIISPWANTYNVLQLGSAPRIKDSFSLNVYNWNTGNPTVKFERWGTQSLGMWGVCNN